MSRIPCDVIKDLLPLYKDDLCSEKSKDLIEEHLLQCEECRQYMEALDMDLPPVTMAPDSRVSHNSNIPDASTLEDIEIFKKIARRISWSKAAIGFFTMIVTIMIISLIGSISDEFLMKLGFDRRIATDQIQVTELYQLEDGDFYITLESSRPFNISSYGDISSPDGLLYYESYDNGQCCLTFEKSSLLEHIFSGSLRLRKCSFLIPDQEILEPDDEPSLYPDEKPAFDAPAIHKNTRIYYKGKQDEELTIWEKGMDVKPAPERIEEKVRQSPDISEDHHNDYRIWLEGQE